MNEPTPEEREAFVAELQENGRKVAERAEKNPWIHELRAVLVVYERTNDYGPVEDFVRRFKADEARRFKKG